LGIAIFQLFTIANGLEEAVTIQHDKEIREIIAIFVP
jgi:hypothetical protein